MSTKKTEISGDTTNPGDQAANPEPKRKHRPLSKKRKSLYSSVVLVIFLVSVEIIARVGSYIYYDFNTYYLIYGRKAWKTDDGHSRKFDGYFKFPPNSKISNNGRDKAPADINNLGFRGPDFSPNRRPGTFRILCLGASSTYGYFDRDAFTYPALLQNMFVEKAPQYNVEVINCGIPHMNTGHILAMLEEELLDYKPDLITLYTGYNDATWPLDENALQATQRWFDEYSAAYAALRKLTRKLDAEFHGRYTSYRSQVTKDAAKRQVELHEKETRNNVASMMDIAKKKGIEFVLIKQPIKAVSDKRSSIYETDYRRVADALEREGTIAGHDMTLYVHHHLNVVMVTLARERNIPIVDNIALVDEKPESFASRVHLTEEANARLATSMFVELK